MMLLITMLNTFADTPGKMSSIPSPKELAHLLWNNT